jgi:hypothetical protein
LPNSTAPVKDHSHDKRKAKMTAKEYKEQLLKQLSNKDIKDEKLTFKKPNVSKSDLYSSIN